MIELNYKTQQDFLNREWVQRLLDAGVDTSDATYCIMKDKMQDRYYIALDKDIKGDYTEILCMWDKIMPTYTVSELLYKLHEYIYPVINGIKYSEPLTYLKDAPFHTFFYSLRSEVDPETRRSKLQQEYICADYEYPIESLASLLIQCHKKDIGMKTKDTGNISDK